MVYPFQLDLQCNMYKDIFDNLTPCFTNEKFSETLGMLEKENYLLIGMGINVIIYN